MKIVLHQPCNDTLMQAILPQNFPQSKLHQEGGTKKRIPGRSKEKYNVYSEYILYLCLWFPLALTCDSRVTVHLWPALSANGGFGLLKVKAKRSNATCRHLSKYNCWATSPASGGKLHANEARAACAHCSAAHGIASSDNSYYVN